MGINPYPAEAYSVTHLSKTILEHFQEGQNVCIAGRLMSRRIPRQGFVCRIADSSGRIQVYFNRDDEICPDEDKTSYNEVYKKLLDIGDFIGIEGQLFTTQVGEKNCYGKGFQITFKNSQTTPITERGF